MSKINGQVGIVLSGGGMRALLYHLGVLRWCAEVGVWSQLAHISSVSGGSWCVGCVIGHSGGKWPDADQFLQQTLPAIKETLCGSSMLIQLIFQGLTKPHIAIFDRAHILSKFFEKHWGLTTNLSGLDEKPRFHINATTFETGKRWAFSQEKMGDYLFGYCEQPDFPISKAVAASSGFPFASGPVKLYSKQFKWINGQFARGKSEEIRLRHPVIHLWDGGVYENTGLEPLYKNGKLQHELDFLIVADAAEPFTQVPWTSVWKRTLRLLSIAMDQVRSLRARQIMETFKSNNNGFYAKIGKSHSQHLKDLSTNIKPWFPDALGEQLCLRLANYDIWPGRVDVNDFEDMLIHGWQTCETIYGTLFERGAILS